MPDQESLRPLESRPERRRLRHDVPSWVEDGSRYFITVCCERRGFNQLCQPVVFGVLAGAMDYYVQKCRWWVDVSLAMPDHWHTLVTFPRQEEMTSVLRDWKRYTARKAGVSWQEGFFDHRLRNRESANEKFHYIVQNPVRRGLCADTSEWPWVWCPK